MMLKGLTKTDNDKADSLLGYEIGIHQEKEWNALRAGRWPRVGWLESLGYGISIGTANSSTINIGILVLSIYDPATKRLVWIGAAQHAIDPQEAGQEPEKSEQGSAKTPEGLSAWTEVDSSESVKSIHALTPALVAHAVDELSRNVSAACKRFPSRAKPPARASTSRKSRIVRRLITRQPEIIRTVF